MKTVEIPDVPPGSDVRGFLYEDPKHVYGLGDVLIYFLTDDLKRILYTEMAPYSLLERGEEQWVDVSFEHPVELPKTFWVALDFRATQTKRVYLSFDSRTAGKHSRVGLPGMRTTNVNFGGDWMVEAVLAK